MCDKDVIDIIANGIADCRTTLHSKNISPDLINKYCKSALNCKGVNIDLSNSLNVTDISSQTSNITQSISQSISNDITQTLTKIDTVLQQLFSSSDYQQQINNLNTEISKNVSNILQNIQNNVTQSQTITLTNYSANNILITSVSDIVLNTVQNTTAIQSIVQNISNQVTQVLNNKPKTITDYITTIIIIILCVIVVIFLIVALLKSESTRNVLSKYEPYIIFVCFSLFIIWLLKFLKPYYILEDPNESVKVIDNKRLILYSSIYIVIFGVVEIIFFRYRKKTSK